MRTIFKLLVLVVSGVLSFGVTAFGNPQSQSVRPGSEGWYIGAEVGLSAGFGTLSTFGGNGFRPGPAAGIFAGRRFNDIFSVELAIRMDRTTLYPRNCCTDKGYYLGSDSNIYNGAVLGMDSWKLSEIRSVTLLHHYGARFNVNLLGIFAPSAAQKWSLDLSPTISILGSRPEVRLASAAADPSSGSLFANPASGNRWHFGYGASLSASYRIGNRLRAGLSTGATFFTGNSIDGIIPRGHKSSHVWETVARLSYDLPLGTR